MSNLMTLSTEAVDLAEKASNLANLLHIEAQKAAQAIPSSNFTLFLTIFILACFVGYYVVWKVTPSLHTPLMSVTNAISGVVIVGSIIPVANLVWTSTNIVALLAIFVASINIFGGFLVTHKMLKMFNKR